jgi:hypothetical protein
VFGGANKHTAGNGALAARKLLVKMDAFQLLHISILRQYIDLVTHLLHFLVCCWRFLIFFLIDRNSAM